MADQPGAGVAELVSVMDRLRRECPWDLKQTHASLAPYLLEETYEALDALDRGDLADLREELGDVLLQVVFHARVASERTDETGFDLDDVAGDIAAKLVRRHPHVFADVKVSDADEVRRNWNAIKAAERAAAGNGRQSVLDAVPMGQPALSLAAQLQRRAEAAGAPPALADLPLATTAPNPTESDAPVPESAVSRAAVSSATEAESAVSSGAVAGAPKAGAPEAGGAVAESADLLSAGASGADHSGAEIPGASADSVRGALDGVSPLGAELFELVARARAAGLNPELELRRAARVYSDRVRAWEAAR